MNGNRGGFREGSSQPRAPRRPPCAPGPAPRSPQGPVLGQKRPKAAAEPGRRCPNKASEPPLGPDRARDPAGGGSGAAPGAEEGLGSPNPSS